MAPDTAATVAEIQALVDRDGPHAPSWGFSGNWGYRQVATRRRCAVRALSVIIAYAHKSTPLYWAARTSPPQQT